MNTKTIDTIALKCDDNLPLGQIATRGEHFTLSWDEKIGGEWTTYRRALGVGARELVGADWADPRIMRLIFGTQEYCAVYEYRQ
jgi:hypothetical protein